jgi:nucleoid-associated protein YgaU
MIARAGTSVVLSLLIVVTATVVLHRPEGVRKAAQVPAPKRAATVKAVPETPRPVPATATSADQPNAPPRVANRPKAAFDRVREGESFADVARRVYGEGANLDAFWKVNRDQMASPEAEVRPGMVLRTPDL